MLASQPCAECLAKLAALCDDTAAAELELVQEYLVFPAQLHLKTRAAGTPRNFTLAVLEYLRTLYKRIRLASLFNSKDLLTSSLVLVAPGAGEDLQLSLCSTLTQLLAAARGAVAEEMADPDNGMKLPLSHLVFTCLTWAEDAATPAPVKLASLGLVTALCQTAASLASLLRPMLPGVTSRAARLVQHPAPHQPASVTAAAVSAWTGVVCVVMADAGTAPRPGDDLATPPTTPAPDPAWLEAAVSQLGHHLAVLAGCASHSDARVRRAVLQLATQLLGSCSVTLQPALPHLANMLILLAGDTQCEEVSRGAATQLDKLVATLGQDTDTAHSLNTHIKRRLGEVTSQLASSLGLYEQERLQRRLDLVRGYLSFLCRNPQSWLELSRTHLSNLLQSLVLVSRLEEAPHKIVLATGSHADTSDLGFLLQPELLPATRPDKNFLHLTRPQLVASVRGICGTLGSSACLVQVTQLLVEGVREVGDTMAREALFVLTSVLEGCDPATLSTGDFEALRQVLTCYQGAMEQGEDCLEAMEGVGAVCRLLGPRLDPGQVLGHLVTQVRSSSLATVTTLHAALRDIAAGQGLGVAALVTAHLQPLATQLNLLLRRRDTRLLGCAGPRLLVRLVVRSCGAQHGLALAQLQDTVQCLLQHLAHADEAATLQILDMVQVFVTAMQARMEAELGQRTDDPESGKEEKSKKGLITRMILDLEKQRKEDEKLCEEVLQCPEEGFHDSAPDVESEAGDEAAATEPPPSPEQVWLETVVQHCRHYISMAGQPRWQMAAINIVATCLQLLAATRDQAPGQKQTRVLPLVHLTWQPLKLCFSSSNLLLVDTAFSCVMVVARVARDFVHSRTVTDVFPGLMRFLTRLQEAVAGGAATQVAAQSRRVLARLCCGVWDLLELLDLAPLETDPIIELLLDHLGTSLTVLGGDTGPLEVVRGGHSGARLQVKDTGGGDTLEPRRNVDRNILWLKLQCRANK